MDGLWILLCLLVAGPYLSPNNSSYWYFLMLLPKQSISAFISDISYGYTPQQLKNVYTPKCSISSISTVSCLVCLTVNSSVLLTLTFLNTVPSSITYKSVTLK